MRLMWRARRWIIGSFEKKLSYNCHLILVTTWRQFHFLVKIGSEDVFEFEKRWCYQCFFKHLLEFKKSLDLGLIFNPRLAKAFGKVSSVFFFPLSVAVASGVPWFGPPLPCSWRRPRFGPEVLLILILGKKISRITLDVFLNLQHGMLWFLSFFLVQVWRTCSFVGPTGEASVRTESPKLGGLMLGWSISVVSISHHSGRLELKATVSISSCWFLHFRSYRFTEHFFLVVLVSEWVQSAFDQFFFAKSQAAPIARKKKGAALTKRVWASQVGISLKKHSLKLTATSPLENRPGPTRKLVTSIPTIHFQVPSYVSFRGVVCFFFGCEAAMAFLGRCWGATAFGESDQIEEGWEIPRVTNSATGRKGRKTPTKPW